jgi:TRAP-type transport system small permease protein
VTRRRSEAAPDPPDGADPVGVPEEGLAERLGAATRQLELEDPDRGLPLGERVINRAVELLGVCLLAGILVILFVNALTRYALNYSFIWAEEVVIGLVPWLAVTGLFLSVRRR